MGAVLINSFGDPTDVVHLGEAPIPEPGAGELRVKLLKSPIHNHDLAIGAGVQGFSVGQRVAVPAGTRLWAEVCRPKPRCPFRRPVQDRFGRVNILVNNAGMVRGGAAIDLTPRAGAG
jgi:NADPH:quinone reductase-like Zn-dependent oxidoreductase